MKLDLKNELKEFYKTSSKDIKIVKVPKQKIISIEGKGDPSTSVDFKHAMEAIFPIAYTIKFTKKKAGNDFAVMPLEGLWWMPNMDDFSIKNKNRWLWKIFIVQPNFVSETDFNSAVESVKEKKNPVSLLKVKFQVIDEGNSAQILYIGPFIDEGPTIKRLHNFIKESGHSFDGLKQKHHEIYLSDMRKTTPEKLKTILRQSFC
jgi:hypothetical protein